MTIANYHVERQELARLATAGAPTAIYLKGDEDYGKSFVVAWLEQEVAAKARVVVVDLAPPQRSMTPDLVMRVVAQELGWEHFQSFRAEAERLAPRRQATVENVTVNGSFNTITASAGSTIEDQLALAIELTGPFLECLKVATKAHAAVTLCLDGYDRDARLIGGWLELSLLPGLGRQPIANILISGRCAAPPELFGRHPAPHALELAGVHDVQEWIRVAGVLKRRLPGADPAQAEQRLAGIIDFARGEPGSIMTYLQNLPKAPS